MFLFCPKLPFLRVFLRGDKTNVSFQHLFCCKSSKLPHKINILASVKSSSFTKNKNLDGEVFVLNNKKLLRFYLVLAAKDMSLFVTTLLAI